MNDTLNNNQLSKKVELASLAILLLSTLLLYIQTVGYEFYFDDVYIEMNTAANWRSNRPLPQFLYQFVFQIWGREPYGFHLLSTFLHMFSCLAMYFFVKRIAVDTKAGREGLHPYAPLWITAVFALHPLQTESVVYSYQAMTVLPMALFSLLSMTFYIRYRASGNVLNLLLVFLFIFAGCTARETTVVVPVLLFFIEFLLIGDTTRTLKKSGSVLIGFCVFAAILVGVAMSFVDYAGAKMGFGFKDVTPFSYLITQFSVLLRYLQLMFLPIGQNLDYDFPLYSTLLSGTPLFSLSVLLIILGLALYALKKKPLFAFGIFWFFIFLAPTSSIVPILDFIFEHRTYMPVGGIAIAVASLFPQELPQNRRVLLPMAGVLVLLLTIFTHLRISVWETNLTLWKDILQKSPKKARPHHSYGVALMKNERFDEAMLQFFETVRIDPKYEKAYYNMGRTKEEQKKPEEAAIHYQETLDVNPHNYDARLNLANLLTAKKRYKEAMVHYERLYQSAYNKADVLYNMGIINMLQGKFKQATDDFQKYLRMVPNDPVVNNRLGQVLAIQGKVGEAVRYFKKAVALKPDYAEAQGNLKMALQQQ